MRSCFLAAVSSMFLAASVASAATVSECKGKVNAARQSLVEMMGGKKDDAQQKKVKDSAEAVNPCLAALKAPAGKDAALADLKKVWGEFLATRVNELVPAILAGQTDKAKTIATGVQKERMDKMNALMAQLGGGDI